MLTSGNAMIYELTMIPCMAVGVNIVHGLSDSVFGKLTFYYAVATMMSLYIDKFSPGFRQETKVQLHRIMVNAFYLVLSVFCLSLTVYVTSNKMQKLTLSMVMMIHTIFSEVIRQGRWFYMVIFFMLHNIILATIRCVMNGLLLLYIYLEERNGWGYEIIS